MSGSIPAGSWQRTGEYHTRGVPVLHGVRWQLPPCIEEGIDPKNFYPVRLLQQDGILYVTYFTENEESACCAIEAQSGTLRWRFTVEDRTEDLPFSLREAVADQSSDLSFSVSYSVSSMALTATMAFVGTTYGVVYGLDLRSGQPTWKMDIDDLEAQLGEEAFEGCSLIWLDGCRLDALAVVGNMLMVSVDAEARGICAIDITKRACLWHTFGLINGPLTLWDHLLYGRDMATQNGSYVYSAYDWHRQRSVWHSYCADIDFEENSLEEEGTIPIEIEMDGCLPLFQKTLYVVGRDENLRSRRWEEEEDDDYYYHLMALDAQTGELRWNFSLDEFEFEFEDGGRRCYVTVANGLVYVSQDGERCAVDLQTHQLRWHHQPVLLPREKLYNSWLPPKRQFHHSAPVLADGLWYECRSDGVLLVLDALTGEERWTYRFEDPMPPSWLNDDDVQPPCLVDDGSVYVIAGTTLYALH